MNHERKLFLNEHKDKNEDGQYSGFRSRHWYSHAFEFFFSIPRSYSDNSFPTLLGLICS